jgi:hypothetical protein
VLDAEVAAVILEPHFDAVRDTFVEYAPEPGSQLTKLKKTRFVVDPEVHDSERHFAMCRDDGALIRIAPEAAELPLENLVAILSHEFGHAADFAYPAKWVTPPRGSGEAVWLGDRDDKPARKWLRLWSERNDDQVEWAADSIASTVTGIEIRYCGRCVLQCFSGDKRRPAGLR